MHWRIADFPELNHLDPQQRAELLARVPWWTYPWIVFRAFIPAMIVATVAGLASLGSLGNFQRPSTEAATIAFLISFPPVFVGVYLLQMRTLRASMRRAVAQALDGRRPPFCFSCGYDLRACDAERCPECGDVIRDGPNRA